MLLRTNPDIKAPVPSSIRPATAIDIERYHAAAVVESNSINKRNQRGRNIIAANSNQFTLDRFRIIHAFDPHLIVDAEYNDAATGVGERDDLLRDLFRIGKL